MRELPSGIASLFEDAPPEAMALSDRIGSLRFMLTDQQAIVLATPSAALERTLPSEVFKGLYRTMRPGETIDLGELRSILIRLGYEPGDPVRIPGQFSQRGGILDLFPSGFDQPIRIELFDDVVESLRIFDPNTQRSLHAITEIEICPIRETLYPEGAELDSVIELLRTTLNAETAGMPEAQAAAMRDLIEGDLRCIRSRQFFDRLDLYRPMLFGESACAVDLLPTGGLLILDDPFELEPMVSRAESDLSDALAARRSRGEIMASTVSDFMLPVEHLGSRPLSLALSSFSEVPAWFESNRVLDAQLLSMDAYRGNSAGLTQALQGWLKSGWHVAIATDQPNRAQAVLDGAELFGKKLASETGLEPGLWIVDGNPAGGFIAPAAQVAVVSDLELFGVTRLKLPQRKFNEGVPITTILDLKDGDYVVHINFGIGIFRGLVTRNVAGVDKEYLFIEYQSPDKLYVPADQLDRIQKYLNPSEVPPKLNRLTGGEWQKTVQKAREEAREFARDLTRLYAQRKAVQRPPFGPDSPWQAEMEATFPWMETRSQMEAIRDAKRDLNNDFPMDRLVCGDVGFGKTEVAIRAAFKVAQAGKQVVMLCPTTILSEQHFRNFAERLAAFPTRIDIINRFRSAQERRDIEAKIENGDLDIVVGTHALLSQKLRFKDLGLVIIDEEHKFGVKQKEALKELRVNVDVLTMSATPIPRTLSMALMDIRQMSLISDPPPGRLPVRTFVRTFSNEVVREAILRELARGGQVYYVYNRVQGIEHVAEHLRKLVPHAKIVVGHGQMHEKELEPVMVAFIKGEADILLSTTIVESGLDIPNANTLIVENSDKMGLAQLYQLRGRVGRSDRQAYAYLLYNSGKSLTENAVARLESLQEFSSLGSGYNLAFRDLQIRGAGDLLGAKQHGTMVTVGYELYTQLIAEEIAFLKSHADGDAPRQYKDPLEGLEPLPALDLPTNARIPEAYIEDQAQRLYYYRTMMSSRSMDELTTVEQELSDRYGKLPDEVKRALWVMRLRLKARELKIEKIDGAGGRLLTTWYPSADLPPRLWVLLKRANADAYLSRGAYVWPYSGGPVAACERMLTAVEEALHQIDESRVPVG